jgi:cytochrome c
MTAVFRIRTTLVAAACAAVVSSASAQAPAHMGPQTHGVFQKIALGADTLLGGKMQDTVIDPMEIAVAPDGRVFIAERKGIVKVWDPKTEQASVIGKVDTFTALEDGLLGVALDPAFATNNWIYLYYAMPRTTQDANGQKAGENVLARFTLRRGTMDRTSEKIMLRVRTQREQCCHAGGSVNFGPDGNLFLSTGDNTNPFHDESQTKGRSGFGPIDERPTRSPWDAQKSSANANDLRGKILRITPQPDGAYTVPDGNLFAKGTPNTRPEIFVMGCRNPFRISVDQKTGYVYWGDVGPDAGSFSRTYGPAGFDEVNQAREAGFFGWPYFVGRNMPYTEWDYTTGKGSEKYNAAKPINDSPNNTGPQELPPAQAAFIYYPHAPSTRFPAVNAGGGRTAMAGPVYHFDENLSSTRKLPKEYDRTLFIYEWSRNWIIAVKLDEQNNIESMNRFCEGMTFKRPMDMELGPDGCLYIIEYGTAWGDNTDTQIIRIEHTGK